MKQDRNNPQDSNPTASSRWWRSVEERTGAEAYAEAEGREFLPTVVDPGHGVDRRRFLQLMGASTAMGTVACTRQPAEKIVPYVRQPEQIVPGRPQFYATAVAEGGYGHGVLVESHMGRPSKVEGNPEHPASLGATTSRDQASVLSLYDPDRSQSIVELERIRTWADFVDAFTTALAQQEGKAGAGLRILTETVTSPTVARQIEAVLGRFPAARWYQYEPTQAHAARRASVEAFGRPVHTRYDVAAAEVILALDADFLAQGPGAVRYAREFARGRRVTGGNEGMNRLYAVESTPSPTGSLADHRVALPPHGVEAFALAVAAALGVDGAAAPAAGLDPKVAQVAEVVARDLRRAGARALVVAGDETAPALHALVHGINAALGAIGTTVIHSEPVEARPTDQLADIRQLAQELREGRVEVLVILEANPVYNAPAELDFASAIASEAAWMRVHVGQRRDETGQYCQWHVPATHYLESWGDVRAFDGTATIQQPLIEPLWGAVSPLEVLAVAAGDLGSSAEAVVRETWRARGLDDKGWRRALHDGVVPGTEAPPAAIAPAGGAVSAAAAELAGRASAAPELVIAFRPDPSLGDGRWANSGWLQELPKPYTHLTWDNPLLISPATAEALGIDSGAVVTAQVGERQLELPVWVLPGQADGCATLHLGFGRTRAGRVGDGVGFDAYALRTGDGFWVAPLQVAPTGGEYALASTQLHHSMHNRHLVREASLERFREEPDFVHHYGHRPADDMTLYPQWDYPGYAWGMVVDTSVCTGCKACVVACQSENNIAVVGKDQVMAGREMHWLRIDQYFRGDESSPEAVLNLPVPCMHCENAPCEVVCPVAATVHSSEGLNDMVYNRCVGTRYCSNNCPYKVRRFNFFKFSDWETESLKLRRNPDVTTRFRGVMEKCTYCVQRINHARIDAETEGRRIRDGEIVTACAQACPTEAIVFGDLNDESSRVRQLREQPHNYGLLEDLNTRPRTTYLARINNPNPELVSGAPVGELHPAANAHAG